MTVLTGFHFKIIPSKGRANRANFCLASKQSTTSEPFNELCISQIWDSLEMSELLWQLTLGCQ